MDIKDKKKFINKLFGSAFYNEDRKSKRKELCEPDELSYDDHEIVESFRDNKRGCDEY